MDYGILYIFSFFSNWDHSESGLCSLFELFVEISFKLKFLRPTELNLRFDFFGLVTLDDIDFWHEITRCLGGYLKLTRPDTIHAVPSALFQLDMATLPGEASDERK